MNVRYVLVSQIYRPISTIRYKKNPSDTIKKKKKNPIFNIRTMLK